MGLPGCIHRGDEKRADSFECRSTRIVHATPLGLAHRSVCERCPEWYRSTENDDRERVSTSFERTEKLVPVEPQDLTCIYRGRDLESVACSSCRGSVRIKTHECAFYGRCTLSDRINVKQCRTCDHLTNKGTYSPPAVTSEIPEIELIRSTRNLAFHLYPRRTSRWRDVVAELVEHMDVFNGRRFVAVAEDDTTAPRSLVREQFKGHDIRYIWVANDPGLQEMATFEQMLTRLQSDDPEELTFYSHCKGVTRSSIAVTAWTSTMFRECLQNFDHALSVLERKGMAGSFRRFGAFAVPNNWHWHYSGTFFWFRHDAVFCRDWDKVIQQPYGVEMWPGHLFSPDEVGCLYGDDCGDLYDDKVWITHES